MLAGGLLLLALSLALTFYRLSLPTDGTSFRDEPGGSSALAFGGVSLLGVGDLSAAEITQNAILLRPRRPEGWQIGGIVPYHIYGVYVSYDFPYRLERGRLWAGDYFESTWGWLSLVTTGLLFGLGCFVFLKQPRLAETRLLFLYGAVELSGLITRAPTGGWSEIRLADYFYPLAYWPANLLDAIGGAGTLLLVHLLLVYPVVKRPLRVAPRGTLALLYGTGVLLLLNSPGLTLAVLVGEAAVPLFITYFLVILAAGIAAVAHTWRHLREPALRAQARWLLWPVGLSTLAFFLVALAFLAGDAGRALELDGLVHAADALIDLFFSVIGPVIMPLLPLSLAIGIWRDNLFGVNPWLNRALVYSGLTLAILAVYGLVVGGLSLLIGAQSNRLLLVLGTGLAAVLFTPLRQALQQAVNRLLYGRRDEPEDVLAELTREMEGEGSAEILPAFAATLARALKFPYVALEAPGSDGQLVPLAAYGEAPASVVAFPLPEPNGAGGRLRIGLRPGEASLSAADERLLAAIARLAAATIQASQLSIALRQSREQLVLAREEERRRLRRDLHDGLGPQLGALTLKLDATRNLLARDPAAAERLLAELKREAQAAIGDVRRLVYGLRPPALDQLGLVAALREVAAEQSQNGTQVTVMAPAALPALPAAVEVAAYHIAAEALRNAGRHARAGQIWLRLALDDGALRLDVEDDGLGLPAEATPGVGLLAMRERAEEVGGQCVIERRADAGTRVAARLPLAIADFGFRIADSPARSAERGVRNNYPSSRPANQPTNQPANESTGQPPHPPSPNPHP